MAYWQIAAGSFSRDYTDRFIRHGLAFVGGDWQCQSMAQVKSGDIVILKRGLYLIVAVGIVVERQGVAQACEGKDWLLDFDGWELPAWCNVDWHVPPKPTETTGLTRATIQGVKQQHLLTIANQILQETPKRTAYEAEPTATEPVLEEEIIGDLIRYGLRPGAAEELTQALRRIRLLARFYLSRDSSLTKEHETRTFLVVPLLQALGWPEQRIQIEYTVKGVGRADIACFRKPVLTAVGHEDQENGITLLIETKGLEQGLDYAPDQAKGYAKKFPSCNVIVVTNDIATRHTSVTTKLLKLTTIRVPI